MLAVLYSVMDGLSFAVSPRSPAHRPVDAFGRLVLRRGWITARRLSTEGTPHMAEMITLSAERREVLGKHVSRLRRAGVTPANL